MQKPVLAAVLVVFGLPAAAQNAALVIGNEDYDNAAPVDAASDAERAAEALDDAGFRVVMGLDLAADNMRAGLDQVLGSAAPERIVILLAGHFAYSAGSTWFLGVDADEPSLATVDAVALSLPVVLEVAGLAPGGAVVLLGAEPADMDLGSGLDVGIGPVDVPQGVTLISGDAETVIDFAEVALTDPGTSLTELLADWPELRAEGFLSPIVPFLPGDGGAAEAAAEREMWETARRSDSIAAYEEYLARYPSGRYAAEARSAIARISESPERVEAALRLSLSQRREVQRQLTLLGHSTRGVDGIFGPGTRSAVTAWQRGRGLTATGYLTRDQLALLERDAARRQAEIEEEERRQQAERERADRAFWRDTGEGRDEAGLRAYLDRYPNGLFADVARTRLNEIVAGRDRQAWDAARNADTLRAYRGYLAQYPNGRFAQAARDRIAELERSDLAARDAADWDAARRADTLAAYRRYLEQHPQGQRVQQARNAIAAFERIAWDEATASDTAEAYRRYLRDFPDGPNADRARRLLAELETPPLETPEQSAARRAEEQLGLSPFALRLVESQLDRQGFDPGAVDGTLDRTARNAIRRYQQDRNLPVTGYLSQQMLVLLAAEGLQLR